MSNPVDFTKEIGWITFTYPDGSVKVIRTTYNPDIIGPVMKYKKPGDDLYDLSRQKWVSLPISTEVQVTMSATMPKLSEVDIFANRFI